MAHELASKIASVELNTSALVVHRSKVVVTFQKVLIAR